MGMLSQFSSKAELHRRESARRFDEFFRSYYAILEENAVEQGAHSADQAMALDNEERLVTLVVRSPESFAAQALRRHTDQLAEIGCELRVIFAHIEPAASFADFAEAVRESNEGEGNEEYLRWARNPSLLDAHEQLVLGDSHCWSGDAMNRSPDVRFALDLFEEVGSHAVDLGRTAFQRLWTVSHPVPKSRFRTMSPTRGEPVVVNFDSPQDSGMLDCVLNGALTTRH